MDLNLILRNAESILFQGKIKAVSANNEKGIFDVLPAHANFITIVKEKLTIHHLDGKDQDITVDKGIIKVENNNIEIFLGIDLV